jgi:hypothetical protein
MGAPSLSGGLVTISDTATPARVGDIFRAEDGALAEYEFQVVSVATNSFQIATTSLPANGNTFYLLREASTRSDSSGASLASVSFPANTIFEFHRHDYSTGNVGTGAYVELIASTSDLATKLTLFDSGGYAMVLAIGAAASEVDFMYIPPGGFNGMIDVQIPAASRLSIKCLEAGITVSVGQLVLNLIGE